MEELQKKTWWILLMRHPMFEVWYRGLTLLFFSFLFLMIGFEDFSMLAWNVRGFANRKSHCHMREILVRFKPDWIVLSETHTAFDSSKRFWEKEG
jgi:hypothetical protein